MNPFNPTDTAAIDADRARKAEKARYHARLLSYGDSKGADGPEQVRDFWVTSTALIVADADDGTAARMAMNVEVLRHSLAADVEPATSLQTFHWKTLELGSPLIAFRFQHMWRQTRLHLRVPRCQVTLGRVVINLRALESACDHGDDRWARQIMDRHFDRLMPAGAALAETSGG